ncbi:peroxiredoxin [Peptococcus simiae]|uniref:peroxiredoxin n=1 Tax=Peptococcus simiae TaxID=1643805 RepID=UPI0039800CAF
MPTHIPMIGDPAPAFSAETTQGTISFPSDYTGQWVILFSHPGDFTPVCSTELMALARIYDQFEALDCELIGLSVDSLSSHMAWLRTMEQMRWLNGEEGQAIPFPIIADIRREVAEAYGMIHTSNPDVTVRATFVIDPAGVIRAIQYYPESTGRNMTELLRLVNALQRVDRQGIRTPADWQVGDDVIMAPPDQCMLADKPEKEDHKSLAWFLNFTGDQEA